MNRLHKFILKSGASVSITIITLLSITFSLAITYLFVVFVFTSMQSEMRITLAIAAFVPAIVAPIVSYIFMNLLFKVDELEKETRKLAHYDALTGLLSRRALYSHLDAHLKRALNDGQKMTVFVADVDDFKMINDTLGHQAGDEALKMVASVIAQSIRANDLAGRAGGDEFVFCLSSVSQEDASEFGQRLINNLNGSVFEYEGKRTNLNLSIGIYTSQVHEGAMVDDFIKAADAALYRAKKAGKNQICF